MIPKKKTAGEEDIEGELQAQAQKEEAEAIQAAEGNGNTEGEAVVSPEEEDFIFKGFANVIPIRGKDSSLDYYLMVMSKDTFS